MKRFVSAVLTVCVLGFAGCASYEGSSGGIDQVDGPELELRIDGTLEPAIDEIVARYLEEGYFPGCQILVTKDNGIVFEKAYGYQESYDMGREIEDKTANTMDTMYDLASCTKVIATTQAVMKLNYEGKLHVSDKVAGYIPEFAENGKGDITIAELLTHTSGMAQWIPIFLYIDGNKEDVRNYICGTELLFNKGELKYSDLGFQMLAFVVEEITGMEFDAYVEENIYKPLGMTNTMFRPLDKGIDKNRIAATSWGNPFETAMVDEVAYPGFSYDCTEHKEAFDAFDGWRNYTLEGEVNDGNSGMANGGVAGHAGLFSTAGDLAVLGQLILNGGAYGDVRLYDEAVIDLFRVNHTGTGLRGYGFELDKTYMGDAATLDTFGHNGFCGTHVTYDRDNNMQIIILTNKQNMGLRKDKTSPAYYSTFTFGKEIANAVSDVVYTK